MTTKKVVTVGSARGITLSKQWLDELKRKYGTDLKEVSIVEINGGFLITPVAPSPTN
jgi:hypothetical protein